MLRGAKRRPVSCQLRLTKDLRKELGQKNCPVVASASKIASVFEELGDLQREVMIAGAVDCKCRLIVYSLVSVGSGERLILKTGDAFQDAIAADASGIFLVHNHPSGSLEPSESDHILTRMVAKAGLLLGYPLLDHVIVARDGYQSLLTSEAIKRFDPTRIIANAKITRAVESDLSTIGWSCNRCKATNIRTATVAAASGTIPGCIPASCTRCGAFCWLPLTKH